MKVWHLDLKEGVISGDKEVSSDTLKVTTDTFEEARNELAAILKTRLIETGNRIDACEKALQDARKESRALMISLEKVNRSRNE